MPRELLADYPQANGRYDEMFAAPQEPRAYWKSMLEQLAAEPAERMRERLQSVQRQMRENGVTYNVYADPQGADRPWELDLLPLILPQEEWSGIEAAIVQRATLLNATLLDVYGEQRLLKEGLLPPALVHGHAGFLRPCHGVKPPGGVMLHLYAADLARSPDGQWWVLDDRTQAPAGAGYALENRIVISRAFPELFRDLKIQHLASFFATLRDSLAHWAPQDGGTGPFTVLLTPGPLNETYFEHAYLARYLGLPLVEGSDLTVREGCVWLKTLSGLKRVHAVLRRLDDDYCDPLELRGDSTLGIPGLVDATRRGNVLVANALGANLLESGTLLGFLPRLCERLLGEGLKMPSVATWWCGEPPALKSVIENLEHLVVKSAFPQPRVEPMFGEDLDERGRKRVTAVLRARPNDYVAQEIVQLSQAPVWDRSHHRRLLARAMGLRVYACASPNGYVAMPGGLTRVASAADTRVISMQRGGSSKDTWVIASGPVSTFSLLRRAIGPGELVRAGTNLSSRVVENLFWFGRYSERCDATARLLRVALGRLVDEIPGDDERVRPMIVELMRRAGILPAGERDPEDVELARAARRGRGRIPARPCERTARARARGFASQGAALARQLAHPQPDDSRPPGAQGPASGARRRAGRARHHDSVVHDDVRICARRDDARPGVALSFHWTAHRTAADARHHSQARACRAARGRPFLAPAAFRFDHHLSRALHDASGVVAGARSAGVRRGESALDRLPGARAAGLRAPAHRAVWQFRRRAVRVLGGGAEEHRPGRGPPAGQ